MTTLSVRRLTAELRPAETPDMPRPSRLVRAWLYLQAALYAAASWGALRGAVAPTHPLVSATLDAGSSFRWLRVFVLTVGMGLVLLGAVLMRRGFGHPAHRELPAAPARFRPVLHRLWHVGGVTRGVMLLVAGLLLTLEAWTYRPGSFGRVTGQVGEALQTPWGRAFLLITAAALAAFAVDEIAAAVYRREAADDTTTRPASGRRWRAAASLLAGAALLCAVLVLVGHLVIALTPAGGRGEGAVDAWFAGHRTTLLDHLTAVGSGFADTVTCITVAGLAATVFAVWLGRWREPSALLLAISGELLIFAFVTATVHRTRPDVIRLDPAPPTSSFPSGHTGAAVALYGCIAVIVLRELRPRRLARVLAAVLAIIPLAVAVSRIYRGMHFPTDVLGGAAAGGAWLILVVLLVLRPPRHARPRPVSGPQQVEAAA